MRYFLYILLPICFLSSSCQTQESRRMTLQEMEDEYLLRDMIQKELNLIR